MEFVSIVLGIGQSFAYIQRSLLEAMMIREAVNLGIVLSLMLPRSKDHGSNGDVNGN